MSRISAWQNAISSFLFASPRSLHRSTKQFICLSLVHYEHHSTPHSFLYYRSSAVTQHIVLATLQETLFGRTVTPAERLRQHQRSLAKAQRELDRERAKLEQSEKKLIADIKKSAKTGQIVSSFSVHPPTMDYVALLITDAIDRMHAKLWPKTLYEQGVTFRSSTRCARNYRLLD